MMDNTIRIELEKGAVIIDKTGAIFYEGATDFGELYLDEGKISANELDDLEFFMSEITPW